MILVLLILWKHPSCSLSIKWSTPVFKKGNSSVEIQRPKVPWGNSLFNNTIAAHYEKTKAFRVLIIFPCFSRHFIWFFLFQFHSIRKNIKPFMIHSYINLFVVCKCKMVGEAFSFFIHSLETWCFFYFIWLQNQPGFIHENHIY